MSRHLSGDDVVQVYDTTLRDGTQREGISLSAQDKVAIARRLDRLGVTFIEGGWPGSNPKDVEFFERAKDMEWQHALIAAFGSTCRVGSRPEDDANIRALLDAATPVCTVVGKTWTLHVKDVLRTTLDENLRIIEESLAYLKAQGRRVIYDAEHFFDGYRADPAYAIETLRAAIRGGAEIVVLCDTNGGSLPWDVEAICRATSEQIGGHPFGIHTHNDGELGVANTLSAVRAGAMHVQGTINGYGERCGNANLCSIIPDLELKMGRRCLPEGHLRQLYDVSHYVAEVANLAPDEHAAYVGRSAFAHKGGIHVAAIRRNVDSYQHIDPALVGNEMRVVVSELSGRGNLMSKAEEFGLSIEHHEQIAGVLQEIKELEARGFSFEAAEASVALMLRRQVEGYEPPFELVDYTVYVEHRDGRGMVTEATVKVAVGGEVIHTAAEGNGPVNALDAALRKALLPIYPALASFQLADYKVRILDGQNGTAATTRVLIDTQNAHERWSTVGASTNIIEASWRALADSIEYGLALHGEEIAPAGARGASIKPEEATIERTGTGAAHRSD
ncbi:MAG TPA: citramalate synthase [Aggregatilineales bacterium]|nr:citramalate synthase [Aggregatilineales bacterium]HPV05846.1 citramalate synthase [Aggregatilineales bacterium]HQA67113.1 citramalate synthase [Aggregatilineales bacterium]HQE16989.1 citramalate synthase [Aggregatilineales bacterium]